jgi:UDP-N-acetylglucosamine 2-epimerase (non-hydrolysing)
MSKLKVVTVVGTRPEIIRLSRVIALLDEHCEHILVHTGQNYDFELNQIFFKEMGLKDPSFVLNCAGKNSVSTISNVLVQADEVLERVNPDALLILGDTNSCLAALPAKRRKIPIFHMEAGNRCFDMRVPEEINRKMVDHLADINLTYSDIAREYLLREGLAADCIIKTGSPMWQVLDHYGDQIEASAVLSHLELTPKSYFVVSTHREENVIDDVNFLKLFDIINLLATKYEIPVIVSTHPRTRKKIEEMGLVFNSMVRLLKPLGFFDYNKLQINALVVLSDSGTISEESSILNFRALNLREAHERPEAMEEASVMMVGLNQDRVQQALDILIDRRIEEKALLQVRDYIKSNVAEKVVRIIHSYKDYVDRVTWKKY